MLNKELFKIKILKQLKENSLPLLHLVNRIKLQQSESVTFIHPDLNQKVVVSVDKTNPFVAEKNKLKLSLNVDFIEIEDKTNFNLVGKTTHILYPEFEYSTYMESINFENDKLVFILKRFKICFNSEYEFCFKTGEINGWVEINLKTGEISGRNYIGKITKVTKKSGFSSLLKQWNEMSMNHLDYFLFVLDDSLKTEFEQRLKMYELISNRNSQEESEYKRLDFLYYLCKYSHQDNKGSRLSNILKKYQKFASKAQE